MSLKIITLVAVSLLIISSVEAKRFASKYCEFELPPGWQCALEGTEWVCQSQNKNRQKEAIIILAAKIRGSKDSLSQYQEYLKGTKAFKLPGGKTQVSEAKYTKMRNINNHRWVDSLHLASEVPGFYTRYVATVKEDLGVAVTFSVAKDHYGVYQPIFDKIVATLRVFRQRHIDVAKLHLKKKDEDLLDDTTFIPDADKQFDISQRKRRKGAGEFTTEDYMIGIVIGIALLFFFMRKKKKK